ncbi:mechanosensitive ion channel family protein [uncultured Corynebacterium sp.]|uniref:mechanosensitive ion channel family protein n=1 Tax=uncultured Corynebacterium sp. TaxID=159447 RepID=UPI0025E472C2|nr:mechanosensitive ion channel domain-containing protein [uncultured Corynebacterium sp.]
MLKFYMFAIWQAVVDHGLPLLGMLLTAILIPRIGRLAVRVIESRLDENEESTKARLALAGALVYVAQAVAYFLLIVAALANLGVPPLGAAIPATVVSAAVGFGAQSIIGDFLAGFFILSEKQFGVGDYVSFDGVTGVEGTVVSLTLRTTTVRTPTGEVVMVPNGSAGVVTNFSQEWSRAVVDIAIPVHEGDNLPDITARVEKISEHAIHSQDIRADVAGELDVLPATGIVAPTVAGQPWQVKYRVLVQVNPARQWAVERAIRSALLASFWDLYKLPNSEAIPDELPVDLNEAPTTVMSATKAQEADKTAESAAESQEASQAVSGAVAKTDTSNDNGPGRPAYSDSDKDEEPDEYRRGIWRADKPKNKWAYFWTVGGRVRASTTGLLAGLGVVGALWLASANPDGVDAGWLSPSRWMSEITESAVPSTESATPEPAPSEHETPASTGKEPTAEVTDGATEDAPQDQTSVAPAPVDTPEAVEGGGSGTEGATGTKESHVPETAVATADATEPSTAN